MKLPVASFGWLIAVSLLLFTGCVKVDVGPELAEDPIEDQEPEDDNGEVEQPDDEQPGIDDEIEEVEEREDDRREEEQVREAGPAVAAPAPKPAVVIQNFQHPVGF